MKTHSILFAFLLISGIASAQETISNGDTIKVYTKDFKVRWGPAQMVQISNNGYPIGGLYTNMETGEQSVVWRESDIISYAATEKDSTTITVKLYDYLKTKVALRFADDKIKQLERRENILYRNLQISEKQYMKLLNLTERTIKTWGEENQTIQRSLSGYFQTKQPKKNTAHKK